MSVSRTAATTRRVLEQLRRDPRTVALLLVVPMALLWLLELVFTEQPATFDAIGPALLALFPFVVMFLVTSVTTLRERTSGTLERLLSMPLGRLDLLVGYLAAFGLVAIVQAVLASGLMLGLLGLDVAGPAWLLVLVAVVDAVLGCALGLFVSAFARTEFQAVQFMPAIVLPQFLLCGLLVPRDEMGTVLEAISWALPLSYAVDAMQRITVEADVSARTLVDLAVVAAAIVLSVGLGAATLRRRTA
jgi:ABC-2 type transport system permease protein